MFLITINTDVLQPVNKYLYLEIASDKQRLSLPLSPPFCLKQSLGWFKINARYCNQCKLDEVNETEYLFSSSANHVLVSIFFKSINYFSFKIPFKAISIALNAMQSHVQIFYISFQKEGNKNNHLENFNRLNDMSFFNSCRIINKG